MPASTAMLTTEYLSATKYEGAKFEYGHPYNDAAYNLVYDAPSIVAKVTRYEQALSEMEAALVQAREQLQPLIDASKVDVAQLTQVDAALAQLRDLRRDLADQSEAAA